jgi:hypothetical protein
LLKGFLPESLKLKSAGLIPEPVDPAVEARRAMRALAMPTPPATGPAPGKSETAASPRYREQNRRDLDRLIGSQR